MDKNQKPSPLYPVQDRRKDEHKMSDEEIMQEKERNALNEQENDEKLTKKQEKMLEEILNEESGVLPEKTEQPTTENNIEEDYDEPTLLESQPLFPEEQKVVEDEILDLYTEENLPLEIKEEKAEGQASSVPLFAQQEVITEEVQVSPEMDEEIPKQKKGGGIIRWLFKAALFVILLFGVFIFGIFIGGEKGVKIGKFDLSNNTFLDDFTNLLKGVTSFPMSVTISEGQLNEALAANAEMFTPLKNTNIALEDGVLVFTGQINIEDVNQYIETQIPYYLYVFFPETINVKAEVTTDETGTVPQLKALKLMNIDFSQNIVTGLGLEEAISDILNKQMETVVPENMTVSNIEIVQDEVICSVFFRLLEE